MEPEERERVAQAIAFSLAKLGHASFINADGSRVIVAVETPIRRWSPVSYTCTACSRRLSTTVIEQVTTHARAVADYLEHAHEWVA